MTDLTIDVIAQYRARRTVGWHEVAAAYEKTLPVERQQTDAAMYCGVLYGLAVVAQPKVIVEIGAQYGVSARMWLAATERTGGMVHSIDTDPECAGMLLGPRWCFHLGRSQDVQPIESDLLYVDGDHGYEAVCSDMARHGTKVRDGGLVVLDDYYFAWPGKVRWISERWSDLDPIVVGPTAIIRVTPAKRAIFSKVFTTHQVPT